MLRQELLLAVVITLTAASAAAAVTLSSEETLQRVLVARAASIAVLGACAINMRLLGWAVP